MGKGYPRIERGEPRTRYSQSPVNAALRRPVITGGQLRMTSQISPVTLPYSQLVEPVYFF